MHLARRACALPSCALCVLKDVAVIHRGSGLAILHHEPEGRPPRFVDGVPPIAGRASETAYGRPAHRRSVTPDQPAGVVSHLRGPFGASPSPPQGVA